MTEPSQIEIFLARIINDFRCQWNDLVLLICLPAVQHNRDIVSVKSFAEGISKYGKVGAESVSRKLEAIFYFSGLGHTPDEIQSWGQHKTLSDYAKAQRAANYDKKVHMRFSVPGSLRELVLQDLDRISKVVGLRSSEELWEYLHSILVDITDDELLHLAGELKEKSSG